MADVGRLGRVRAQAGSHPDWRRSPRAFLLVCVLLAACCPSPALASARAAGVRVTIIAATHRPKVNVPWPVRVTVTSTAGKPLPAKLTMVVLFLGAPVGKIDNGAVYHLVGSWQERPGHLITWPAASRGEPLTFQAVVTARGVTVREDWAIDVT